VHLRVVDDGCALERLGACDNMSDSGTTKKEREKVHGAYAAAEP
jgi:hypothetical protein